MKILMLGLGAIGQRHVRNLRALLGADLELRAVRSKGLTRVLTDRMQVEGEAGLHEKYGIEIEPDLETALAAKPDAVMICNPTSLHLSSALAAARAGCAIFVEKPLAHHAEGLDELVALVEERRLTCLVGYQFRFHPCLRKAQEWLAAGLIGNVLSARAENAEYLPNWHPYEDYRISYAARRDLGGGALLTQIHEMDYLFALFGAPRRLVAMGGHLSRLEVDVEDSVDVLIEFDRNGASLPVSLHLDYLQRPPARGCQIIGDDGKIVLDFVAMTARRFDAGEVAESAEFPDFQRNQLFLDQTQHFLDCLGGKAQPIVSVRDAAQSLHMALAAKESLESKAMIELAA